MAQIAQTEIEQSEGGWDFEIVDKSIGEYEGNNGIKVWIDQRSVGQSGDSFAGTVCVELPNKKYLMWHYEV